VAAVSPAQAARLRARPKNSIQDLSDQNAYLRAAATLPIAPSVHYHSIMGRSDLRVPLAASSDGFVPYASAHLDGASSEHGGHSTHGVRRPAEGTLEIRRILKSSLAADPSGPSVTARGREAVPAS